MSSFEEKLESLTVNERKFIEALAIFWESASVDDFLLVLRDLELLHDLGSKYNSALFYKIRAKLGKAGFFEQLTSYGTIGIQIKTVELREQLTRDALASGWFDEVFQSISRAAPLNGLKRTESLSFYRRFLRDYRIGLYRPDLVPRHRLESSDVAVRLRADIEKIQTEVLADPFQPQLFANLSRPQQAILLPKFVRQAREAFRSTDEYLDFAVKQDLADGPALRDLRTDNLIFKGDFAAAARVVENPRSVGDRLGAATLAALNGGFPLALQLFREAIDQWRREEHRRKGVPNDWKMIFYALLLLREDLVRFYEFTAEIRNFQPSDETSVHLVRAVTTLESVVRGEIIEIDRKSIRPDAMSFDQMLMNVLVAAAERTLPFPEETDRIEAVAARLGFDWIRFEIANLVRDRGGNVANFPRLKTHIEPVKNLIPAHEDWERALNALVVLASRKVDRRSAPGRRSETRTAWLLDYDKREVQPVIQRAGRNGWTDGRNIAIRKLADGEVENLTEHDLRAVKAGLDRSADGSTATAVGLSFHWERTIGALVGHPHVFLLSNPSVAVTLVETEPTLIVRESGQSIELSFDTSFSQAGVIVRKETETRWLVIKVERDHVDISTSIRGKLLIPPEGRDRLLLAARGLSEKVNIQSDLQEHLDTLPFVERDDRIHALVTPLGDGFHVEFFVKPFGSVPPYFKPGKGVESVSTEIDGVRTRTRRDISAERELVTKIEEMCPSLAAAESLTYEWQLSSLEELLIVLSEFDAPRRDGLLAVEWTKGRELKLLGSIGFQDVSLRVNERNDWFEVDGEIRVNEDLVVSWREFNSLLTADGRNFVELSDGQFVAITEKLRKHLESLRAAVDDDHGLHHLRIGLLEDLAGQISEFEADAAWHAKLRRISEVSQTVPELPSTFQAELRPYQLDGFRWLSRLAQLGVGACLADDMGLGKTLQAMAVLVERAPRGPALVVAPVSVCRNWLAEAQRFAPTLRFHLFGTGDRESQIRDLGPFDVIVSSYNLLQFEEELFSGREFSTIVLDEAQAFKNRNTKRSRAVMNLKGEFRILTTGTPIENHLGELWNLFNFINPGLLGSHDFFAQRFGLPIERTNDETARRTLHRLIAPFVLRRRKSQVLDDLPAKTEIVLTVAMSDDERAFYEAVRREALTRISSETARDQRFRILAELTKLRLACCHPSLVNENADIESSKLELFGEVLDELLDNQHKALVFSQFVKHLAIIRQYLDKKGISYQYLDGSTSPAERQRSIDRFQQGEGDVFLISLKAGGTGLNLTAADYVIHLDPWWNPAVEDQATDRAHRIGQQRPVTVYRLVTENSVEEKILRLHETKRDLADSLLAETDTSARLTAEDLLALIRG